VDFVHLVGWLFVAAMAYAAMQSLIGWREYKAMVRGERALGLLVAWLLVRA
jgi:hypothetical protein